MGANGILWLPASTQRMVVSLTNQDGEARAGWRANAKVPLDMLSRRCFWDSGSPSRRAPGKGQDGAGDQGMVGVQEDTEVGAADESP